MVVAQRSSLFETSVSLAEKIRGESIEILNARLADALDLQMQAKQAHWNVKGMQFYQLHLLFDEIAERVEKLADTLAERITALGGVALGTARIVAARSTLPEYDMHAITGEQHVRSLSKGLSKLANAARAAIDHTAEMGDQGTSDVFTEIVRSADKDLWFLEAHLQG